MLFFSDNFVHVDVYYKELLYTVIEQQPSFLLLSLFGEVGGFMGLLLGASVLTFCEFIDFILQVVLSQCGRKKQSRDQRNEYKDPSKQCKDQRIAGIKDQRNQCSKDQTPTDNFLGSKGRENNGYVAENDVDAETLGGNLSTVL